ncbi:ABC transporter permease [Neobacillus terrae]|uniref:ABC transporter permease n=1 Tax=Neobacillus terrae TaxID=3034837 RepID=UPI00140CFEB9|nr:ABC transporter permease [Neobacillus terrae]NHM31298.1 ABC transporter permease [Neobacillus terrae]
MSQSYLSRIGSKLFILLIFGFITLPVFMVIWISFFKNQLIVFPPKGYSTHWYMQLADQGNFAMAFFFSLEVSLLAMIISLVLGLLSSLAITHYEFRGKQTLQTFLLSPLVVPAIITGIAIYIFLFKSENWLGFNLVPSFWSLTFAHVIITLPWTVRLISAGLQGVNRSLEEAAVDLGASKLQTFWYVIMPSIRPSLVAAGIFAFIFSFNNLEISLMLVSPRQTTLPIEILNYVFWKVDPFIAAVSTVQIIVIAGLMLIADRFVGLSKVF